MKKNKKKINKKLLFILIAICILLVLIILINILINKIKNENNFKTDQAIVQEQVESYMDNKTFPRGLSVLHSDYDGKRSLNDLYRNLNVFVVYMPELANKTKNMKDKEITTFYSKNEDEIKEKLGISTEENFKEFITYINQYDFTNAKFLNCDLDKTSMEKGNVYYYLKIGFNFENISEPIVFQLQFSMSESISPVVIYGEVKN